MSKTEKTPLSTESYKGVRDFFPKDMALQNYIFSVWRKTCESFGYVEYNASILEPSELYRGKSSEEIVTEQTYTFTDRGEREVTLRPEMTPTVSRMIAAKRREIRFPARWFSIANVFRYERPQKGRLREHFQLNADLFGVSSNEAEIEMLMLAYTIMKNFGLKDDQFVIKVNDKGFVRKVLEGLGLSEDVSREAAMLIDKKDKVEHFEEDWVKLTGKAFNASLFNNDALSEFTGTLKGMGISNIEADPLLVRGFEYYSGIVFEIFDTDPDNRRSLFGGGRYDGLVSLFGGENIPAVGFGMGDVTIKDTLETYGLLPSYHSTTDLTICVIDTTLTKDAHLLARKLREKGMRVAVDFSGKKLGDQIQKADKDGVRFVLPFGEEEAKSGAFKLKELVSGKEILGGIEDVVSAVRS